MIELIGKTPQGAARVQLAEEKITEHLEEEYKRNMQQVKEEAKGKDAGSSASTKRGDEVKEDEAEGAAAKRRKGGNQTAELQTKDIELEGKEPGGVNTEREDAEQD